MSESESKKENRNGKEHRFDPELRKKGLRCDLDQYEMLKRCSEKKDITEWNKWREEHPDEDIWLQGASLSDTHLERAYLAHAHLEGATIWYSHLKRCQFVDAHLEDADLRWAHLEEATFVRTYLQRAELTYAHLEGAVLMEAKLQHTKFMRAELQGADFTGGELQGADFSFAVVDGETALWACIVDQTTDFRGVGLDSCRIDPATKQLLEYNIRWKNWEKWYKDHWFWRLPIRFFWWISDYGLSAPRLMGVFFILALVFAAVYYVWGFIDYYFIGIKDYPGIVSDLFVLEGKQEAVSLWLVPFRAIYFSIVTMTTLGFGDMYANAHSFLRGLFGHVLLAIQVILGYVLLGALVTRFAVLFTAGGLAGKFAK